MELWYFAPPILLLFITPILVATLYKLFFENLLPVRIYNFLLAPVVLFSFWLWAYPMSFGFYEFFRALSGN